MHRFISFIFLFLFMEITAQQILESAPKRFRAEKAAGINTIFHFDFSGSEPGQYTLTIADGTCRLEKGLTGTSKCTIRTSDKVYVDLETGKANPQMALMTGKVKVSNLTEMMAFAKLFRKFDEKYLQAETAVTNALTEVSRPTLNGPLKGIRIIDFSRLLPGPLATMLLADMGAEIIKIEDPDNPDYVRDFEPMIEGTSAFYYALNRSKKSLAVNYLDAKGKALLYELVKTADVVVEQFRPGVMKSLGLDYETLKQHNPKLIYASITGYGQNSSLAQAAGHDLNYISIAGLLGINGPDDDTVVIPGFQLADIAGGSYMAMNAILAALFQRERTGAGEHLDIAMTDAVVPFTAMPFAEAQANQKRTPRGQFQLAGGLANYNVFKCSDGKFIALGSLEPKFWTKICTKLGKQEWSNEILSGTEKQDSMKAELKAIFSQKTRSEWVAFFKEDDVCVTGVNELDELASDTYIKEKQLLVEQLVAGRTLHTVSMPVKFGGSKTNPSWVAPMLGEDSVAILKGMNYSEEQIRQLAEEHIVKVG